jgi:RNA polymerase sigma factor (sigma-70 family)
MTRTDSEANFEDVWNQNYVDVYRYVLRRVGDQETANEICAETFLVAWRKLDTVPAVPKPWLLGVARRVLANHWRGEGRRQALVAKLEADIPEPPEEEATRSPILAAAFNALSEMDREVLSLVVWEELRPGDAAKVLGINTARFSVRLYRAKERLRKRMQGADLGSDSNVETPIQTTSQMTMEAPK